MDEDSVSVNEVMLSWLTHSCLFIIVNLVIGTIAITSRFAGNRKQKLDSSTQLVGSNSSFLERLTSFGFCSYKSVETQPIIEPVQNRDLIQLGRATSPSPLEQVGSSNQESNDPIQIPLTRAPSILERIMSIKLHRSGSKSINLEGKKSGFELKPEIVDGKGEEESVDAKADDFIRRFKQQLRLERLDSILRYSDLFQRN